ncbi:DNRLRE domain-containing protein [Actinocorallia populi]|uniref:DNRLRE domain-containing protein n=1 Tax=Actinocorallia populi TaxID=2079200 RepID=UPI000D08F616|nr:DNRLRE domain-containing protein [Actinocorallia populi]
MKARLTALTSVAVLSTSLLAPAAQADPASGTTAARAKASPNVTWAYVSSKKQKKSFYKKKGTVPVGRVGGAVHRAYYRIDLADVVSEDIVSSVRLRVPVKSPNACRRGVPSVKVQQTRALAAKPTWKKQPKATRTLGTVKPKCSGKVLDLDFTQAARKVLEQGGDSLSFRLVATSEKKAKKALKLSHAAKLAIRAYSDNDGDGDGGFGDPAVNRPQAVANASLNGGGCQVGAGAPTIQTGTATFTGTTADADGGFVGLRVEWETDGAKGAQVSKMQFSGANEPRNFTITLPAGTFKEDGDYRWRLQGFDDFGGGAWTGWCGFEVDLPAPPPAPVVPPVAPPAADAAQED